ncbi:hypothetical protein BGW38_002793 [Lunasporangiospora selenospora]|uniref:Uncharacterized protein n=1 Tax=Lunasporangiospora selenospora TaxID=979761 RepID=A0A9P6FTN7_9FUNG|nr:hypothetical protein BGW38_002793 [Lunasporangiospora selenospora]
MPTRNAYIATLSSFVVVFVLQLISLFNPSWIQYTSPEPFYTKTTYGLFQKCSTLTDDCRRFPQKSWGDCDHDKGSSGPMVNLCVEWRAAAGISIASTIVGVVIVAGLSMVLYAGETWHARGWKHLVGLISLFAGWQALSMGLIVHASSASSMFAHHRYGASFILSGVSWGLTAVMALGVLFYAKYMAQGYIALQE